MKTTHLRFILIAGTALLAAAGAFRLLYKPKPPAKPPAPSAALVKLDAELQSLQADIAAHPDDLQPKWKLADFFRKIGRLDKAAETLSDIQRRAPASADAAIALGNVALAQKDDRRAEALFAEANRKWPRSIAALQGLSTAKFHQKLYWDAAEAARKAISLNIDEPNSHFLRATALLHYAMDFPDPLQREGALREARATFVRLLAYWPDPGELYLLAGKACLFLNLKPEAIKHLRRAQELIPASPDAALYLARAYMNSGERDKARGVLEAAITRKVQSAPIYDLLGQILGQDGKPADFARAVQLAQNAVRLSPSDAKYHERLGTAYLRVTDLPAARAEFEAAAKIDPDRAFPYQQLAAIYSRMGEPQRAGAAAQMATRMVFNDNQLKEVQYQAIVHPRSVNLHLILADRYRDLKQLGAARDEYRRALLLEPNNARARSGLADVDRVVLAQAPSK